MKRLVCLVGILVLLSGCGKDDPGQTRALALRQRMLEGAGCSFDARITGDYGDSLCAFALRCRVESSGAVSFQVLEPASIAGISGTMTQETGNLTFDGHALAFPMLADGLLAPVAAPWVLIQALRGGYLSETALEGETLTLTVDDSYREDAMILRIRLDGADTPISGEIYWKNRRLLTMTIENFQFL